MTAPVRANSSTLRGRGLEELPGSPWRFLLLPVFAAYRPLLTLRGLAYDVGLLPRQRLNVPVVSIGNIVAGGAGKTPAAMLIAGVLRELGRTPAVLMRGYRAARTGAGNDEAQLYGDIPVVCDIDRIRGGRTAIAAGADALILDDGFQHRRLHRDLDIVVIDATRPFGDSAGGRGACLPLGWRREGLRSLRRAGMLWLSRADLVPPERLAALRRDLTSLAPQAACIEAPTGPLRLAALFTDAPATPAPGAAVVLASGIGNPAAFAATVGRAGYRCLRELRFPDHHRYDAGDAELLVATARAAEACLLITAKDAVKLREFAAVLPGIPGGVFVVHADPQPEAQGLALLRQRLATLR